MAMMITLWHVVDVRDPSWLALYSEVPVHGLPLPVKQKKLQNNNTATNLQMTFLC